MCSWLFKSNRKRDILIYIPSVYIHSKLNISVYGNFFVSIEIKNFEAKTFFFITSKIVSFNYAHKHGCLFHFRRKLGSLTTNFFHFFFKFHKTENDRTKSFQIKHTLYIISQMRSVNILTNDQSYTTTVSYEIIMF